MIGIESQKKRLDFARNNNLITELIMNRFVGVLNPFIKYTVIFWLLVGLLFLPMLSWDWYNARGSALAFRLLGDVSLCAIIAYTVLLLGCLIAQFSRKFSVVWITMSYLVTWMASYVEVLMIKFFHTRFATFVMQVVDETSGQETLEFFRGYFLSTKFAVITVFYICVLVIGWYTHRWIKSKNWKWVSICSITIVCSMLVCSLISDSIFCIKSSAIPFGQDSFSRFFRAYRGLQEQREQYRTADLCHLNIDVDSCSFSSPKIVLIIGESYIKRHSPLYGYTLQTTPNLSGLDSLYVFNDVITSVNTTTTAIRNLLSLSSIGEGKEWYESPYFMAFFKKSGYHVSLYSNQYPKGSIGVDGTFLDQPIMNEVCFDFRNLETYPYDGDLIDHFEKDRSKLEVGEHWLIMVHLMGQHMMSAERYPSSNTYFTADSIKRPDLSEAKRWEIAHYDNATRYNDEVVGRLIRMYQDEEVIFVYLADHGDEVYDFRDYAGRNFDMSCGADMLHCHIDVPLLIYATPQYRERHPDMINRIVHSLDNPFMTDDLPHLMMDLAGINSPAYKSSKSPINPAFDKSRKRMIGYDVKYDYDEICR